MVHRISLQRGHIEQHFPSPSCRLDKTVNYRRSATLWIKQKNPPLHFQFRCAQWHSDFSIIRIADFSFTTECRGLVAVCGLGYTLLMD